MSATTTTKEESVLAATSGAMLKFGRNVAWVVRIWKVVGRGLTTNLICSGTTDLGQRGAKIPEISRNCV